MAFAIPSTEIPDIGGATADTPGNFSFDPAREELPWRQMALAAREETGEFHDRDSTRAEDPSAIAWINSAVNANYVARHSRPAKTARFIELQRWEGVVETTSEVGFSARLFDKTAPSNPQELADFDVDDVDAGDRDLIEPGAVFYWTIGYFENPTRSKQSTLRFRRLPVWTRRDVARVEKTAIELAEYLRAEDGAERAG